MKVCEVIALYLRHCELEDVHCAEARAECLRTLGAFGQVYGELTIAECRPFMLSDWVEGNARWKSMSTRRVKANIVRACFNWAAEGERIERHPFKSVRFRKAERRPDMRDVDFEALCQLASKPYERVLRFLRMTGRRLSEVCRAVWADFDLERGLWWIHRHKGRKRTGKPQVVALVPQAVELLRVVAIAKAPAPVTHGMPAPSTPVSDGGRVVFLNSRGRPWSPGWLGQYLIRLKERHGLTFKPSLHGIRHRFGSAGVGGGGNIKLISKQLGHASVRTTEEFYCDLDGEMEAVRGAAEKAQHRPK